MELTVINEIDQPAARVWALWADFGNVDWLSGVFCRVETEGEGVGMVRYLYRTPSGVSDIQRLEAQDHDAMVQHGAILRSSFLNVTDYSFRVEVTPLAQTRCRVTVDWRCEPAEGTTLAEIEAVLQGWTDAAMLKMAAYLRAP